MEEILFPINFRNDDDDEEDDEDEEDDDDDKSILSSEMADISP